MHNHLQNIALPLRIQHPSEPLSPALFDMSPAFAERPNDPDQGLVARLEHFRDEFKPFLEHLKFAILIPLSWTLTLWRFVIIIIWRIWTLPLRLFLTFYERQVRRAFPWLPSIYGTLNSLFPGGIKLPSLTNLTAGPYKGAGPTGPELPTLDMSGDINDIINGTGNGDASSQQLEGNLDGALKDVKKERTG